MTTLQTSPPGRWLRRWFGRSATTSDCGVCFFIPDKSRGWILEAACREIAQRLSVETVFTGNYKALPQANAYYFCHYHFYLSALRINPWLKHRNCFVWFTHPKEAEFGEASTIAALRQAHVITMNSHSRQMLIDLGLDATRVHTIVGAADPALFAFHRRGEGKVGFCTAYYERKMPDRILELTRALPEFEFILMGRNWDQYPRYGELIALDNLRYCEASYAEYPAFYRELDVFISASQLEGGPIPLLESMMSNVVPVASNTGFAPDVIVHGENGFLFDADEPDCLQIATLVRQAKKMHTDVRRSVEHLSWDTYAQQHAELFGI